jgi:hypothetical protein
MVATFLQGELPSTRFPKVREILTTLGIGEEIVAQPDLANADENEVRSLLLQSSRGYPATALFQGFPADCAWQWCTLQPSELTQRLVYINYPAWAQTYSDGSRSPSVGAAYMEQHPENVDAGICTAIADRVRAGDVLPPIIVVGTPTDERLVVLEGNARLTAMVLAVDALSSGVRVLRGLSPRMSEWVYY